MAEIATASSQLQLPERSRIAPPWIVGLSVIAALFYNSWIVMAFLNPQLSLTKSFLSEYAVTSEPYSWVPHLGDSVAAICIAIFAFALARRDFVKYAFYLFAVGTIIDGFFPMPCLESVTSSRTFFQNCSGFQSQMHSISSFIAGVAMIMAILASIVVAASSCRYGDEYLAKLRVFAQRHRWVKLKWRWMPQLQAVHTRKQRIWLWIGMAAGALYLIGNLWIVVELGIGRVAFMGMTQRISVFAIGVWWIVMATQLPIRSRRQA